MRPLKFSFASGQRSLSRLREGADLCSLVCLFCIATSSPCANGTSTNNNCPNSHLLEKIQKMGQDSLLKGREVIDGEEVPLPIKRRLVV